MPRSQDGRVGQRGDGGDDRGQLADVVQVDVDARRSRRCPVTVSPSRSRLHVGAHRVEDVAQRVAGLGGALRPARHGAPCRR